MKYILLIPLVLYAFSISAIATPQVALINNVDSPPNYCCWINICSLNIIKPDLGKDLEKIFHQAFSKTKYQSKVFTKPDQFTLSQILTTGGFDAIFYISHADYTENNNKQLGFKFLNELLDHSGVNISPILQWSNASFFALCACFSEQHLAGVRRANQALGRKTDYFGFPSVVDAKTALRTSIKAFFAKQSKFAPYQETQNPPQARDDAQEVLVQASRFIPMNVESAPSVQIIQAELLRAVLPAGKAGEIQSTEFIIKVPELQEYGIDFQQDLARHLKIEVSTGLSNANLSNPKPGLIFFSTADIAGYWGVYRNPLDETPMGISKNIYFFEFN